MIRLPASPARKPGRISGPGLPAQPARGMTLIEVMVALAIVAIALLTGLKATGSLLDNADRLRHNSLAQLCADNALVQLRLLRQLPDLGTREETCTQAGQNYAVQVLVNPTPNPNFRRVDARVGLGDRALVQVSTVVGRQ
jgi:general secretion pathway protein I